MITTKLLLERHQHWLAIVLNGLICRYKFPILMNILNVDMSWSYHTTVLDVVTKSKANVGSGTLYKD